MDDLRHRFDYHQADPKTGVRHADVRVACLVAAETIVERTPAGREQALAITKLEEAMMWANAAIARNPGQAPDAS